MHQKISKFGNLVGLCVLTILVSQQPLSADIILSPGATWEYTFTDPTGDPAWNTTTGGWTTGPAPFGNVFAGDFGYEFGTFWQENTALWVRTTIDLTSFDLSTILYELGVDNGFTLYANGVLVASDSAEGYTERWEYSGLIPPGALHAGPNVIAVALEDHGVATAFDMQITGRINGVPDGGVTLGMLALGMLTIRAGRRLLS